MKELIKSALPGISDDIIDALIIKLDEIGVLSVEDFEFVEENNITDILKPIQAKKFIKFCQAVKSHEIFTVDAVVDHSNSESLVDIEPLVPTAKENTFTFTEAGVLTSPWAQNFKICFDALPKEIKEANDKNCLPKNKSVNDMVNAICIQIKNVNPSPGRKNLRIIADRIVQRFPILVDRCGSEIIGSGSNTIFKKLENCLDNKKRASAVIEENFGEKKKRKTIRDSYGCVDWQPVELPENETKQEQQQKRQWLIEEYKKADRNFEKIQNTMDLTYPTQRYFINNVKTSILCVKENWPFLMEEVFFLRHCDKLLGMDIVDVMTQSFQIRGKKIYDFMVSVPKKSQLLKQCLNNIQFAKEKLGNLTPEIIGAIPLLMAYFNEEEILLFQKEDSASSSKADVLTPYISTFGFTIYEANEFTIVIDGHPVIYVDSYLSALICMFASYYVFNIEYHEGAPNTMEFIQRCYANINPQKGTKVVKKKNKKQYTLSTKVMKLLNELKSFENVFQ